MIGGASAPEPSRTLAILFGASRWPKFPGLDSEQAAPAYAAAASSFRSYLLDPEGLALPQANLLDLFDSKAGVVEQDTMIREFIERKNNETATIQDLIVMYVGHGSTVQPNKFIFVLGSTTRDQRELTAYRSESLGKTLKEKAPVVRKWIFLDCCVAQAAYGDFQPGSEPAQVLENDALISFPPSGTAFYAACSSDDFAYSDPAAGSRMFTAALTDVLRKGAPNLSERLTLSEVALMVRDEIQKRHGPDMVAPYIGDPDQRKGELSVLPFFPNPARRQQSVDVRLESLKRDVASLEVKLTARIGKIEGQLGAQTTWRDSVEQRLITQSPQDSSAPGATIAPGASRSPWAEIERKVAQLDVSEQINWDEKKVGYFLSKYILVAAIFLAACELIAYCIPMLMSTPIDINNFFFRFQQVTTLLSIVLFVLCSIASLPSASKSAGPSRYTEALDELLRGNTLFRKIYFRKFKSSIFGIIDRRSITFTLFLCLFSIAIGILGTFPNVFPFVNLMQSPR